MRESSMKEMDEVTQRRGWRAFPMHCYPAARCNPILPSSSKRFRLPNPLVRGGMATPIGATGSKVRFARNTGAMCFSAE